MGQENAQQRSRQNRGKSLEARFRQYVVEGGPDDCWMWVGCIEWDTKKDQHQRCGVIRDNRFEPGKPGKLLKAHRVAYAIAHGLLPCDVPKHLVHTCSRGLCQNPAHLRPAIDNEAIAKILKQAGRYHSGARWYIRRGLRVTPSDLPKIRQMRNQGRTLEEIAAEIGVSLQAITNYLRGHRLSK